MSLTDFGEIKKAKKRDGQNDNKKQMRKIRKFAFFRNLVFFV